MSRRVTASLQTATTSLVDWEIVQWIGIRRRNYARGEAHDKGARLPDRLSPVPPDPPAARRASLLWAYLFYCGFGPFQPGFS